MIKENIAIKDVKCIYAGNITFKSFKESHIRNGDYIPETVLDILDKY